MRRIKLITVLIIISIYGRSADAAEEKNPQNRFYMFEIGVGGGVNPLSKLINIGGKYGAALSESSYGMLWYEVGANMEYEWFESSYRIFAKPELAIAYGGGLLLSLKASIYGAVAYDFVNSSVVGIGTRPTACFLAVCIYYAAEVLSDGKGFDHAKGGIYFTAPLTCLDRKNCLGGL